MGATLLNFFIADAWAAGGPPAAGNPQGGLGSLVIMVLFVAFTFFILIRPQQKRAKEHRKMVEGLKKGDEVVTNGGLLGRITDLGDNFVRIKVADGVEVKVQRQSVAAVMPKGTMKEM